MSQTWYVNASGEVEGPLTLDELNRRAAAGQLLPTDNVSPDRVSWVPAVELDSYNLETKDDEGFLGDRVTKGSFRELLENWRKPLRKSGNDPFGKEDSEAITKKTLDFAQLPYPGHTEFLADLGGQAADGIDV